MFSYFKEIYFFKKKRSKSSLNLFKKCIVCVKCGRIIKNHDIYAINCWLQSHQMIRSNSKCTIQWPSERKSIWATVHKIYSICFLFLFSLSICCARTVFLVNFFLFYLNLKKKTFLNVRLFFPCHRNYMFGFIR